MSRPKLAKSGKAIKDASQEPARLSNPKVQQIIKIETVDTVKVAGSAVSGVIKMVLVFVLVLATLYALITATLMAAVPGNAGFTWLARSTFVGGEPKSGDFAYVSSKANPNEGIVNRMQQGISALPDGMVVEIIAGPAGTIKNDKDTGRVIFNGKPTNYVLPIEARDVTKEYLAVCVKGACEPGEQLLIDKGYIVGEAKGTLSMKGLEGYDSIATSSDPAVDVPSVPSSPTE